jgi:hypothetical protein
MNAVSRSSFRATTRHLMRPFITNVANPSLTLRKLARFMHLMTAGSGFGLLPLLINIPKGQNPNAK